MFIIMLWMQCAKGLSVLPPTYVVGTVSKLGLFHKQSETYLSLHRLTSAGGLEEKRRRSCTKRLSHHIPAVVIPVTSRRLPVSVFGLVRPRHCRSSHFGYGFAAKTVTAHRATAVVLHLRRPGTARRELSGSLLGIPGRPSLSSGRAS